MHLPIQVIWKIIIWKELWAGKAQGNLVCCTDVSSRLGAERQKESELVWGSEMPQSKQLTWLWIWRKGRVSGMLSDWQGYPQDPGVMLPGQERILGGWALLGLLFVKLFQGLNQKLFLAMWMSSCSSSPMFLRRWESIAPLGGLWATGSQKYHCHANLSGMMVYPSFTHSGETLHTAQLGWTRKLTRKLFNGRCLQQQPCLEAGDLSVCTR